MVSVRNAPLEKSLSGGDLSGRAGERTQQLKAFADLTEDQFSSGYSP